MLIISSLYRYPVVDVLEDLNSTALVLEAEIPQFFRGFPQLYNEQLSSNRVFLYKKGAEKVREMNTVTCSFFRVPQKQRQKLWAPQRGGPPSSQVKSGEGVKQTDRLFVFLQIKENFASYFFRVQKSSSTNTFGEDWSCRYVVKTDDSEGYFFLRKGHPMYWL